LQGAQRILRGEVLYRDFFSYFTPGSYYFLALLFKVFGSSFLVARSALVFFGGIYSAILYLLVRGGGGRGSKFFVVVLSPLPRFPNRSEFLQTGATTLGACLAFNCGGRGLK